MVPFGFKGDFTVESVADSGSYVVTDKVATIKGPRR